LDWISDPSNQNQRFSRNFIRHEVLPVMTQYYSAAVACVSRTIRHCREAEELLEILAQQDLAEMEIKTPYGNALSVEIFLRKTIAQQKNVLRVWLKIQNILPPEDSRLSEFLRQLRAAKADKHPTLPCGEWILTIYQSHIYTYSPAALEAMKQSSDSKPGGKSIKKRLQALKIPPWMRKIVTI
jgi:tRNA(Ile)-lysidine synthase